MCRWIAYRGETTALGPSVPGPDHSLIPQSIHALEATASVNGDGFGLGWYGTHPEPGLYREIRPAWPDENLRYLCRHLQSHLVFAHVRAAAGTAVTRVNCHPVAWGQWLFMLNGFVGNWNRLRRKVEGLIPDQLYPQRIGTTDTEAIFLAIMGAGIEHPLAATESVLQKLTDFVNQTKPADRLRVTAALSNGRDPSAFRYAVNAKANTLYSRESDTGLLMVSEPIDQGENWIAVPENHALVAPSGERARVVPLLHQHPVAGEKYQPHKALCVIIRAE